MLKKIMFFLFLVSCILVSAYGNENVLRNPGFETVLNGLPQYYMIPEYWSGTITQDTEIFHSGKASGKLSAKEKYNRHWGRFMQPVSIKIVPGGMYRFSMWTKGKGEFLLGVLQYTPVKPGEPNYKYFWQEKPVVLTDKWCEVSFIFTVDNPDVKQVTPVVEVRGENAVAFIDDGALGSFKKEGIELLASTGHFISYPSAGYEVSFTLVDKNRPVADRDIGIEIISSYGERESLQVRTDEKGRCRYAGTFPADAKEGGWRFVGFAKDTGAVAEVLCDLVDRQTYEEMDIVAKKIHLTKSLHILYIGDSLTDFQRGNNYVDKINFWLNKYNPGKVSFRNAGVGGDLITRVWDRLNGMQSGHRAYRQEMYNNLFEPTPDIIFILLGHNDTLLIRKDGKEMPAVSPEVQENTYRKVLAFLKEKTAAEIVFVSATSSVYEVCKENNDKRVAAGGRYILFGKPEVMEVFNSILKKLSSELKMEYIDIYGPMKKHPNKPSLFSPADGVHLTEKGNRFIALHLLKYLSTK
jgi:lysophospholipase L1-like esterase